MSCSHHDKRSVNGVLGGDGKPVYGCPPTTEEEPAWCRVCGALWFKSLFGWGWSHPLNDREAPDSIAEGEVNSRVDLAGVAKTLFQTGRSLLNNELIHGLVLRVITDERGVTTPGPLGVVFIRKGLPETAQALTEALKDVPEDLAYAEKIAAGQEEH